MPHSRVIALASSDKGIFSETLESWEIIQKGKKKDL